MTKSKDVYYFWKEKEADPKGMCLNKDALEFSENEKLEIISYLPIFENKIVLELGAGIGRFTGHFALSAKEVVAVDFIQKFIKKNKETHSNHSNIIYITGNVLELDFKEETFDFIFMNWMLMYLSDDQTRELADKIHVWLKPEGHLFLRESCACASIPDKPVPNTNYREIEFYPSLFSKLKICFQGYIKIYEVQYGNPNQLWWLFTK